jgi:putative transcriptional regulator
MARVTSENFADRLLRSAQQAVAIKQQAEVPARVVKRKVTARRVAVEEAPRFDAARIAKLRRELDVSQPVFAGVVGVKPVTVKAWEQGQKEPSGTARRLLQLLEADPGAVMQVARMTEMRGGATGGTSSADAAPAMKTLRTSAAKRVADRASADRPAAPRRKRRRPS